MPFFIYLLLLLKPSLHTSRNKNQHPPFKVFVFQFCDVAKMTIIHQKKKRKKKPNLAT
jgi:hypothetical protein